MGVIGPGHEAEDQPAISLLALSLPGATITTLAIGSNEEARATLDRVGATSAQAWLLFADPFTTDVEALVGAIGQRQKDATVLGGLASAQPMQRNTAVFLDGEVRDSGAVLVGIGGAFGIHTVVAQGAEPIGQPWTITECEGNLVRTIGSRPALEVLQETLAALDAQTRERAQRNLLVGLAMDEYRHQHARGDFLIRNILGRGTRRAARRCGWTAERSRRWSPLRRRRAPWWRCAISSSTFPPAASSCARPEPSCVMPRMRCAVSPSRVPTSRSRCTTILAR